MLLSKCSVCNSKKSKFLKEKEAKGLSSNFFGGIIQLFLEKILLIRNALFKNYKMNARINKILLEGDKFMPEMYLRQPGFTYSAVNVVHSLKTKIYLSKRIR